MCRHKRKHYTGHEYTIRVHSLAAQPPCAGPSRSRNRVHLCRAWRADLEKALFRASAAKAAPEQPEGRSVAAEPTG